MKSIKIITAVDRTQITNLQGLFRVSKTSVRLPGGIIWQRLTIKPHAQLTISDKVKQKKTHKIFCKFYKKSQKDISKSIKL